MPFVVTGSPVTAVVAGIRAALEADVTLMALIEGVFGHLSEAARTPYPYLVIARRSRTGEAGAMAKAGSMVSLQIDVWHGRNDTSNSNVLGPGPVQTILSRVAAVLERQAITVSGFSLIEGSLTCEFEDVTDEPDVDSPDRRLYHGVQRWLCEVHES